MAITMVLKRSCGTPNDAELNIRLRGELQGSTGPVYSLDWSPVGNTLVSSGYGEINLWDMDSLKHVDNISHHDSYVWSVSWSPDGKLLAAGNGMYNNQFSGGTIYICEISDGKL